jgi:hypothetical protein
MVRGSYFVLLALFACFLWSALAMIVDHRNHLQGSDSSLSPSATGAVSECESKQTVEQSEQSALEVKTSDWQVPFAANDPANGTIALDEVDQDDKVVTVGKAHDGNWIVGSDAESQEDDVATAEPTPQGTQVAASETTIPAEPDSEGPQLSEPGTTQRPADAPALAAAAELEGQDDGSGPPPEPVPDEELQNIEGTVFPSDEIFVYTDYQEAMKEAVEDRKLLCIYFHGPQLTAARRAFETETLSDVEIQEKLKRYVFVKLPRDAQITVDGQEITLLEHASFAEMLHRQGIAIVDLAHVRAEYYGYVVSTFPFTPGKYYRKKALSIILDLPPATLTQRTMIYAVRVHPEAPASTQGQFHTVLAEEAKSHAKYQAAILVQGHHSWDSRFHRINSRLPSGVMAQEVVAESWPNESLVEACIDCVHSWRQSPGHWGAVRSRHPLFGYDIKRGRNGIWYATGIFGRR